MDIYRNRNFYFHIFRSGDLLANRAERSLEAPESPNKNAFDAEHVVPSLSNPAASRKSRCCCTFDTHQNSRLSGKIKTDEIDE